MSKENEKFEFNTNWYDLWMKQSKEFFDSAEKNLQGMFKPGVQVNPQEHMEQINSWINSLKHQWQFTKLNDQQKAYENYWNVMTKMCTDASDMMMKQWMQRSKDNNPVRSVRDLYELWLNCCNEVYRSAMHSKSYQEAYGEFMNAAIHFWKSSLPK